MAFRITGSIAAFVVHAFRLFILDLGVFFGEVLARLFDTPGYVPTALTGIAKPLYKKYWAGELYLYASIFTDVEKNEFFER